MEARRQRPRGGGRRGSAAPGEEGRAPRDHHVLRGDARPSARPLRRSADRRREDGHHARRLRRDGGQGHPASVEAQRRRLWRRALPRAQLGQPRADTQELRAVRALCDAAVPGLGRWASQLQRVGAEQPADDLQPQRRGHPAGVRARGPRGTGGVPPAHVGRARPAGDDHHAVKRSSGRFLTTHTGSLPRPDDLIHTMFAKEEGVSVDAGALAARIREAVAEVVRKQTAAGVSVVDEREMSKPSYSTYVKDQLTGFGGASHSLQYQDLVEFPGMARRVFGDPGRARRKTPACTGPIAVRDRAAAATDAENLKAALAGARAEEGFLSAASPGVISLFFRDEHYGSHEKYLFAIAEAMRHEYETVARAGLILQIDCPDLAMGRHIQYAALST